MIKIGFLLPRSTVYPLIGHDFLDGYKAYIEANQLQNEVAIVSENIGFGIDEADVYAKNEKLLLVENVDVVVAFLDGKCSEMLAPLYNATGKILLLVNMGASYGYDIKANNNVIHHTFNVAFNSWLTGKLAASKKNAKAVMATSFYDGGYLQCFAMVSAFTKNGGEVVNNFVSHFQPDLFDISKLQQFLEINIDVDTLICLYSGDTTHLAYPAFSNIQKNTSINLYVSPMMLDEMQKKETEINISNTKGYTAWMPCLQNNINVEFKNKFQQQTNRQASIFALLGWEAALLVNEISKQKKEGLPSASIIKQLQGKKLLTPRGWIQLDEQTNHTFSSVHLISCNGNYEFKFDNTVDDIENEKQQFLNTQPDTNHSAWRNTYLCS